MADLGIVSPAAARTVAKGRITSIALDSKGFVSVVYERNGRASTVQLNIAYDNDFSTVSNDTVQIDAGKAREVTSTYITLDSTAGALIDGLVTGAVVDSRTGAQISPSDVVSVSNRGLTVRSALNQSTGIYTYEFIANKDLAVKPNGSDIYQSADAPQLESAYQPDEDSLRWAPKMVYDFGVDAVMAGMCIADETSGFISEEINIGACSFIRLSALISGGKSSYEFSILDGAKEIPIIPVEMSLEISREKIFPGLPARFPPNTNKPIIIYKNGELSGLSYSDLPSITSGGYDISYSAYDEAYTYRPNMDKIRVKVIQRLNGGTPSVISAMSVQKFGGDAPWLTLA